MIRIFEDKETLKEAKLIHFGTVKAGMIKVIVYYLKNDSETILTNLFYSFPNLPPSEVLFVEGPTTIQPYGVEPLKLTWKPSPNFRQALSLDLEITGEEIFVARY